MCGIAGIINKAGNPEENLLSNLTVMSRLIEHRGPDGDGIWCRHNKSVGLAHRRLSIIDISEKASQPMVREKNYAITYNGEIYNHIELRNSLKDYWNFQSESDTECILAAYSRYGDKCLDHLRGMFAFSLWDESKQRLFCARDRFGIKPFYYCVIDGVFRFASEAKALVPFLKDIETSSSALAEYLTFQYTIGDKTLFKGIRQLLPGHYLVVENNDVKIRRYWDVCYEIDSEHSTKYFSQKLYELVNESLSFHLRSDVPIGSYVSGGVDSSLIHILANQNNNSNPLGFHGRFTNSPPEYDESIYAKAASKHSEGVLNIIDIDSTCFKENIRDVIYHLDFPVAGPGAFPQYMVSKLAAESVKVVLGGQGGDELFGGYARYLIAYLEQCLNAAIDGKYKNGNYVVTIESIIPNLGILREYKPLLKEFWSKGLFESMDNRYFRLIDRSTDMNSEILWDELNFSQVKNDFKKIFNNPNNVKKEAYFDKMTHYDLKCLLPALLQVEDRMSMAHGVESRVPFLDHRLVEFAATIPANVKFRNGSMKPMLKGVFNRELPEEIINRRDKMGFPVPLTEWVKTGLSDYISDVFQMMAEKDRPYLNSDAINNNYVGGKPFSRKTWGLLSLELWYQAFHDQAQKYRSMLDQEENTQAI